jgi:hypothetical protein
VIKKYSKLWLQSSQYINAIFIAVLTVPPNRQPGQMISAGSAVMKIKLP